MAKYRVIEFYYIQLHSALNNFISIVFTLEILLNLIFIKCYETLQLHLKIPTIFELEITNSS